MELKRLRIKVLENYLEKSKLTSEIIESNIRCEYFIQFV